MSKKNTAATIATIIVAVLAIATTLFLLYRPHSSRYRKISIITFPRTR